MVSLGLCFGVVFPETFMSTITFGSSIAVWFMKKVSSFIAQCEVLLTLRADQGASITDHWNHSGTAEPRFEFVERQQDRERDETNALIAFYTDRGVGYKYRPKKKGRKSKNINFETPDQFTQSGLTESRKVEWNKW